MRSLPHYAALACCLLIPALYLLHLEADSMAGLFGILWSDEGVYLLSAKHDALFGSTHPFAEDLYRPEYTTPLLHQLGLLVMTKQDVVWGIRFAVALITLCGIALLAHTARRHLQTTADYYWCVLTLLLCPMWYFYARIGLSEGIQFALLAAAIWAMQQLYDAATKRQAIRYAALIAVCAVTLFLAKITSISACVGVAVGTLATILVRPRAQRASILTTTILSGLATVALLYIWWVHGHAEQWWHNNIDNTVFDENIPQDASYAWERFKLHFIGLHHFLILMPIFAIGFWGMVMAADRRRGFIWILWLTAMTTLGVESFFGGELRRSFFGLSLMLFVGAIMLPEWLRQGIQWQPWTRARIVATIFVGLFLLGLGYLIFAAFMHTDPFYFLMGPFFLGLILLGLFMKAPRWQRARMLLVATIFLISALPMLLQVIIAPRTITAAVEQIEAIMPPEASVGGFVTPWMYTGLRRQIYFTNCTSEGVSIGNPYEHIPWKKVDYFLTFIPEKILLPCTPPDFDQFEEAATLHMFYPFNKGYGYGGSVKWIWRRDLILYRRKH